MNIFEATLRISKMMEQKYGCSVDFFYYDQINTKSVRQNHFDQAIFEAIERNLGAQFVIACGKILMPIYIQGKLFGSIVVREGEKILPSNFEDVHIFLDSTLKDFIVKKESLRRLKIEEAALDSGNVIPLIRTQALEDVDTSHFDDQANYQAALFLTGGDYSQVREISLDIHTMLKRNSFVPYSLMEFNNALFSENLPELGRISIFIPEILDLSFKEREQIFEYVHNYSSQKNPFLIISSQTPLDKIETENLLEPEQIEAIKKFHLTLTHNSGIKDFYSILLRDQDGVTH